MLDIDKETVSRGKRGVLLYSATRQNYDAMQYYDMMRLSSVTQGKEYNCCEVLYFDIPFWALPLRKTYCVSLHEQSCFLFRYCIDRLKGLQSIFGLDNLKKLILLAFHLVLVISHKLKIYT